MFQIKINTKILKELRNKINEEQNISYNKKYNRLVDKRSGKKKVYRAWDKICAIMDRLDDTVDYLNELKLNMGKDRKSAFDFYDFMNNAAVVIDCIKELAKIFNVEDSDIKTSNNIFNQLGSDNSGTDEKYFEYLRSLCSVHPIETSRHKMYQENDFECSPYVMWKNSKIWFEDDCDLHAVVYTSKDNECNKRIKIYISQVFDYVITRVDFVSKIIESIKEYHNQVILEFKSTPIKMINEFSNYTDYLRNLDKEANERYGSEYEGEINYIIGLLELNISNPKNENKMKLYINSLKYSIEFKHHSLQNMSYVGFKNNGIIKPKDNYETSLLSELYILDSGSNEKREYCYNFEKIGYLNYDSGDSNKNCAYVNLKKVSPFLERYVSFEGATGDLENYTLVQLALYLHCLENECSINHNIPNDLKYREKLL